MAVAPPDADEVDVLVRYVYPGVRFSQGKVVVLRAPKTGGADRADPVDDAAAATTTTTTATASSDRRPPPARRPRR